MRRRRRALPRRGQRRRRVAHRATPPDPALIAEAQTLAVTALALFQVFYLLTCRTLKEPVRTVGWWSNPYVFARTAVLVILQAGFMYLPFMQDLFGTAPSAPASGPWPSSPEP